ncbi:MAG: tripartite tricarboxylate transporter substrate-binding protein, partial [Acidimicrobiia bacterium]
AHLGAPVTTMPIRVFESAPQALADVVGGGADIGMVSAISAVPGMGDEDLTPVLVTSPDRIGGSFEEVPTCLELAVPCVRGTWRGLVGPPGIDDSTIGSWSDRLRAAVTSERWRHILDDNLWVDNYLGPDDVGRFLQEERVQLAVLLEQVGLAPTVGHG